MHKLNEMAIYRNNQLKVEDELGDDLVAVTSPVNKEEAKTPKRLEKELSTRFKDQDKSVEDFLKSEDKRKTKFERMSQKMKLDEKLFEEVVSNESPADEAQDIYYKAKRDSLADVIQMELTDGETVYKKSAGKDGKPKWVPTTGPCLNLDTYDVSVNWEEVDGEEVPRIQANVTPDMKSAVIEIADKYGKKCTTGTTKRFGDKTEWIKIWLDDKDFDEGFVDSRVLVRSR
ncbi:MAG: hypothetical protein IKW15_02730 [Bacteroidales bacterium]|nr:hypothetical protein [Bacteroidales bacterium]